jgi:hypothetical protein
MASKLSVLVLVLVGLTFSLWTIAMLTPGWLIMKVTNEMYPQGVSPFTALDKSYFNIQAIKRTGL